MDEWVKSGSPLKGRGLDGKNMPQASAVGQMLKHGIYAKRFYVKNTSKESGLGEPGFDFTPEGWSLPLDVEWNDGMVE